MAMFLPPLDETRKSTRSDGPAFVLTAPLEPIKGSKTLSPSKTKGRRSKDASASESESNIGDRFLIPSDTNYSAQHTQCISALSSGHLETFIDLFTVTNEDPDDVGLATADEDVAAMCKHLTQAENAERQSDFETAYMAYKRVADHFEDRSQLKTSRRFRAKAQTAALQTGLLPKIAAAHNARGLVEEKLSDAEMATACFEDMFRENAAAQADQTTACANLVRTKTTMADDAESSGDIPGSLALLRQALDYSEKVDVPELTSSCLYRIGRAAELLGDTDESIQALERYINGAHPPTATGRNQACAVLARCYERKNDLDTAIQYLKKLVEASAQLEQLDLTTDSAEKLGGMYEKLGDLGASIEWYTRAYNAAMQVQPPTRALPLRIALGKARANALRKGYVAKLQSCGSSDILALLDWKARRTEPFSNGSVDTGFRRPTDSATSINQNGVEVTETTEMTSQISAGEEDLQKEIP